MFGSSIANMKSIFRNKSVLTGKMNLEKLVTIPNFPIFIGCTEKKKDSDIFQDLSFDICKDTGAIQLSELVPLDILYKNYHSEAIGSIWQGHHNEFLSFINKYKMKNILEIGGSNGALASSYLSNNSDKQLSWTIVEPGPSISNNDSRLKVISDYFPTKEIANKKFDGIIHTHVFEHMYDPASFLKEVADSATLGCNHLFSVPNLMKYVLNKQANALNFEHTIFLTEEIIDQLLTKAGFQIVNKQYYLDHSIFYATKYTGNKNTKPFPNYYKKYKKIFLDYINTINSTADFFNKQIESRNSNVYIFGAHVFSQFLLKFGLTEDKLSAVLDNSKFKQGKRLYGTNLVVKSLESIKNETSPTVIVNAGQYQDEIKKQLLKINPSVEIIEKK